MEEVFLPPERIEEMLGRLRRRKNIILQGPPGVGKTFVARRLAWLLLGERSDATVKMVQLHPGYGYEDFVQGFRPTAAGGFERRDGLFVRFCEQARLSPETPHVLLVDEINRGNLSRIFGELLMLLEADKRGPGWRVDLAYGEQGEDGFFVPDNVYLIGTMNTADRSLALVDYALRRRFVFFNLEPSFGEPSFAAFLSAVTKLDDEGVQRVVARMGALNAKIVDAAGLGAGYCVGHSYFCVPEEDAGTEAWFERIVRTEVKPLLDEYFFDAPQQAEELVAGLLVP